MDMNSIREALRRQPFQPFVLRLADGRSVPVDHPEFVATTSRIVVVAAEDSSLSVIEPLLIVSLDTSPNKGKGRNGSSKKRRGS